jgi:cysteine desulfurase/selenocysteine lyase
MENIEKWERELSEYILKKLKEIEGIKIYCNEKNYSGILSFNIYGIHPHDVASILNDYKICVRAGHHCNMPLMKKLGISGTVRISFYLYNTFEDADKLIEGIKKVKEKFGR